MPRPEQTPPLRYEGLPYGANAIANAAETDFAEPVDDETFGDEEPYVPGSDEEQFLLGPTDRPDEPMTTGYSFGPGAGITSAQLKPETKQQFATRIATTLQAEGEPTKGLKDFLARVEKGY